MDKYCYNCMNIKKSDNICEHCGSGPIVDSYAHHLSLGTVLNNRYMVGHAIGEGGFGITYIGRDLNLDMIIAIKEFYPNGYANRNNEASSDVTVTGNTNVDFFEKGKAKFIREARVLAKFSGNKSIVDVRDYFEDNNTAYIVMEYVDGMTLKDYLKTNGNFDASDIFDRFVPLCEALKKVHKSGLIHRDISPDNIMILKDGSLKLMDFGAARDVNFEDKKSLSIMLKPGYAPEEQYRSKGKQGPWTDIYAICATIYKCITGVTPDDSMERVFSDELKRPSEMGIDITARQEDALLKGMAIYQKDRFKIVDDFISEISDKKSDEIVSVNINSTKHINSDDEKTEYFEEDDDKTEYYDYDITEEYNDDDEKTEYYDEKEEIIDNDSVSKEDDERAKIEAEEKAKREAEEKAKREAEEKAKREAEEKAKREAEEKAKREAEEKAKREAEKKAKRKAEEKERKEAAKRAKQKEKEKALSDNKKTVSEEKEGGKSKKKYVVLGISAVVVIVSLFIIIGIANSNTKNNSNSIYTIDSYKKAESVDEHIGERVFLKNGNIQYDEELKEYTIIFWKDNTLELGSIHSADMKSGSLSKYVNMLIDGTARIQGDHNSINNIVFKILNISSYHEFTKKVPSVEGMKESEAKEKLVKSGFVCNVKYKYNAARKGTVFAQNLAAGQKAKYGTVIGIEVSKGPKLYKIPNVKGDYESTARNKLKKAKLRVSVVSEYSSSVSQGKVIKQSKKAGKEVKKDTKITITVSLGAKPTQPPATRAATPRSSSRGSSSGGSNGSSKKPSSYSGYEDLVF